MFVALFRRLTGGHPRADRPAAPPLRFVPQFTVLEDRAVPSASPVLAAPPPADVAVVQSRHDVRVVPFKITGGGPAPAGLPLVPGQSAPHSATGTATHLGKHTTEGGTFTLRSLAISPTGAVTGTFEGSIVFVAANGDKLAFKYGVGGTGKLTGQVTADGSTVVDVKFDAVFTADPANSTGRFANVTGGSFRMIAQADSISLASGTPGYTAPFNYTWSGEGTLEYAKGKK